MSQTEQKKFFRSERSPHPLSLSRAGRTAGSNGGVSGGHPPNQTESKHMAFLAKTPPPKGSSSKGLISPIITHSSTNQDKSGSNQKLKTKPSVEIKNRNTNDDSSRASAAVPPTTHANTATASKNEATSKRKVMPAGVKHRASKPQDVDEHSSSSSDTPPNSNKLKVVKRRVPPKYREKVNKETGSKLNENPRFMKKTHFSKNKENTPDWLSDEDELSDEDLEDFGKQVDHLMVQLGSKIENRIRVRSQKLTNAFEAVLDVPAKIAKFESEQRKLKESMIQDIQAAFAGIQDELQKISTLQANNAEKCCKLLNEETTAHENTRKLIAECKTEHSKVVEKFLKDEKKHRSACVEEEKQCLEQNGKEIRKLRTKLMLEGELQSSEVLHKL